MGMSLEKRADTQMFDPVSDFAGCLLPMLDALGWRGSLAQVYESLPHQPNHMGYTEFLNVMAGLKFGSLSERCRLDEIDARLLPCLFVPDKQPACVLVRDGDQGYLAFDGHERQFVQLAKRPDVGSAVFFHALQRGRKSPLNQQENWFRLVVRRFMPVMLLGVLLSLVLSVGAIVVPIFTMTIYDQVFAGRSDWTLYGFVFGAVAFLLVDVAFRLLRSWLFSFVGIRLGYIAGSEIFRRILFLPPAFTETASLGAQISRIRDFETVRDFFTGSALLSLLELPFVAFLLLALFMIAGPVTYVPLAGVLVLVLMGMLLYPKVQSTNARSADSISKKRELTVEMLTSFRAIKYTGTMDYWMQRYEAMSADAALYSFEASHLMNVANVVSQMVVTLSGVASVAVGVLYVLSGGMTSGALMAAMMLVWRILMPLRTGFGVVTQLDKLQKSIQQLDRLMNLQMERNQEASLLVERQFRGNVSFSQVSIRYLSDSAPALMGVSFELKHGETLLVIGHDGAGKSTLLKLILGMYHPQGGRILVGSQNVRQMDPALLRRSVGYASQHNTLFYGTIAQNLRFADPSADQMTMEKAARKVALLEDIEQMPEGFNTRVGDHNIAQLSASFQRRVTLARVFLRRFSIMLFDEPERGLTPVQEKKLLDALNTMKGDTTVIMTTTRPLAVAHVADMVLWLENGRVRAYGPGNAVMAEYRKSMESGT
jgi:ATP-binding cassette subfamily C protein LapB